jgi:hypothetical protein
MRPLAPTSPQRDRRILAADAAYAAFLAPGFPLDDYPGETLQIRNELDRTNWLTLKDICAEAIAAGVGDLTIDAPGIRCTSNAFIRPTYAETFVLMQELRAWAMQAQANWWRLKDECRSVTTRAALEAIDMGAGWP